MLKIKADNLLSDVTFNLNLILLDIFGFEKISPKTHAFVLFTFVFSKWS